MQYFVLFFGLLLGYTLIYAGLSKIWADVTVAPKSSSSSGG